MAEGVEIERQMEMQMEMEQEGGKDCRRQEARTRLRL
jgi:hypothetical protein